jgi:hypothetical protein
MTIKALRTFKASLFICQLTWRNILVDTNPQNHRCKNQKSHIRKQFFLTVLRCCCYVKMPLRMKHPVASIMPQYSQHPELTTKNDTSMRQNTESFFFFLIRNSSFILGYIGLNSKVKLYDFHAILTLGFEKNTCIIYW